MLCLHTGNIDANTYEDTCREMFGVHAYVVFTIDRLMQNLVRQVCPEPSTCVRRTPRQTRISSFDSRFCVES